MESCCRLLKMYDTYDRQCSRCWALGGACSKKLRYFGRCPPGRDIRAILSYAWNEAWVALENVTRQAIP